MKKVLTIAGSDSSGGAGIQADIKTITAHGLYAMSAITALTAQNTMGVYAISEVSPEFLSAQLDAVFTDIKPDAVKIGMVSSKALIDVIAEGLERYDAKNIVVDPVMVSTSGSRLLEANAQEALVSQLLPLGTVLTPNIPEAEILSGMRIQNREDMVRAAQVISEQTGSAVLVKGGHRVADANDCLVENGVCTWFSSERIATDNTHGTGCTLSSAIACGLAQGSSLKESIAEAKTYLSGALGAGLNIGHGSGPLNHMWKTAAPVHEKSAIEAVIWNL